jgi:DNA-binding NarL/FixJ family response regulator
VTSAERVDAGPSEELPAGLTAREIDVLRLVAVGLSDAEAARRLFLSVRTVNAHLRSIYRKLGVSSRVAAGRFAETNGLL